MERQGEKIGWIGGWLGGFIWIAIMGVVWLVQKEMILGAAGIALFAMAVITIWICAPWKYPETKYWQLMLPVYVLFFCAIALCVYFYGEVKGLRMSWVSFLWVFPCLIPLITLGNRTWNSGRSETEKK